MKLLSSRKIAAAAEKQYASYASAVRVLKMNFLAIWRLKTSKNFSLVSNMEAPHGDIYLSKQ